ncbi:MAG: DUF58 domain-containing protein [Gammaproteobacteria bacterium]|nr:DUF58 domain-containing protein [Gammaproteobacteria bacterium]
MSPSSTLFDSDFLSRLEALELVARRLLRGGYRGEHNSRQWGRSLDFADFRRYQPGDDLRYVDWNIYSRLERLFLKLFAAEEDLTLHVLVDGSASMGFGEPLKFDYARRLAAALTYVASNRMDRVLLNTFRSSLELLGDAIRCKRQMRAALEALGRLACGGPTHLAEACRTFAAKTRYPGVVVVISDLLGDESACDALRLLSRRGHDCVLVHLLSEDDIEPLLEGPLRLVDAETGAALNLSIDSDSRDAYRRRLQQRLSALESHCRRLRIEYLRVSTALPFEDVVLKYLREGRLFA